MADVNKRRKKSVDARNAQMFAERASGATQKEIADKFQMSATQVQRILNSDQALEFAETQKNKIFSLLDKAVKALDEALDKGSLDAANMAFKIAGFYVEKHKHDFGKPFVLKLSNGTEIQMGHKTEKESK